jgi:hypothetical protein
VYSFYEHAPRAWGLSPLADQQVAGNDEVRAGGRLLRDVAVYLLRFLREESTADAFRVPTVPRG